MPAMVDVGGKPRTAPSARGRRPEVFLPPAGAGACCSDGELHSAKGPVFRTAVTAGIMAAKRTAELIPLCHPIGLDRCNVTVDLNAAGNAVVTCVAAVEHKTGVEMEALTGASVAALTIYDMCKALSHDMTIREVRLLEKSGGKSDYRAGGDGAHG